MAMIVKDLGTHPEGLGGPWQGFTLWNQNYIGQHSEERLWWLGEN